jgi:hypothetical protein
MQKHFANNKPVCSTPVVAGIFLLGLGGHCSAASQVDAAAMQAASASKSKPVAADRSATGTMPSLDWEKEFRGNAAPRYLKFSSSYRDAKGEEHRLNYWRDGKSRLRRTTDDKVDLMVERLSDGDYRYHVLDHRKKIVTDIDQSNLYRIGHFGNWNELAHVLAKPAVPFSLQRLARKEAVFAGYSCKWYQLTPQGSATAQQICWSEAAGVPLRIVRKSADRAESVIWQIERLDTRKIAADAFTASVNGYARVDANLDISPDAD